MNRRVKAVLAVGIFALATPAGAQRPGPITAFDGTYAGVSMHVTKATRESAKCPYGGVPTPLTIKNGLVGPPSGKGWRGTVNSQGTVVMQNQYAMHVHAQIDAQGNVTGQYTGPQCNVTYLWRKQAG
jgi:hypothetical protein